MAGRAGLPWRFIAVGFVGIPVVRKNKFYQQPVLLNQSELVASLAHDIPVSGKLPRGVGLLHTMAAVAELRVLLDIVVITDSEHDPDYSDDEHKGDNDGLFPWTQAPFNLVEYF